MQKNDNTTTDPDKLAHYLKDRLPGYRGGPLRLEKFAAGESNPTFRLLSEEGSWVLRRKPPGELLASAHAVDREYRLLQALQNSKVPVATPYLLCEDESVIGSMFYVMSHEDGQVFWDPALPEIDRGQRPDYYHALIGTLADLHEVDHEAVGLADFGRPGNYFARQLNRWRRQYEASATESIPAMDELMDWLDQALPEDDGETTLIHGDYRLDNVMFHHGEPRPRAVLDWELATLGHPMADLAYYCMALRLPREGEMRGLDGADLEALNIPGEEELIALYCSRRGIGPIRHWPFYLAFSFFRLAAILQGVYRRGLEGNASSQRAQRMGKLVHPLASMGLAITKNQS